MKINVTFALDSELLKKFIAVVEKNNSTSDEEIAKAISAYTSGEINPPPPHPLPPLHPGYVALTETVLASCKKLAVGQLVNQLLRGLLERGVATDWEIGEMQKASGPIPQNNMGVNFGIYCNQRFNTPFPLLIAEERRKRLANQQDKNKFWNPTSIIGGKKFHLCSQWAEGIHREYVEKWIRNHLPEWFKNEKTTDEEREKMETYLKRNFLDY